MFRNLLLLNELGSVDIGFFVGCAVAIVLIVGIYFLIPVFNKKQYQEQRDNLKKREEAFKSNRGALVTDKTELSEDAEEDTAPVCDVNENEESQPIDSQIDEIIKEENNGGIDQE